MPDKKSYTEFTLLPTPYSQYLKAPLQVKNIVKALQYHKAQSSNDIYVITIIHVTQRNSTVDMPPTTQTPEAVQLNNSITIKHQFLMQH